MSKTARRKRDKRNMKDRPATKWDMVEAMWKVPKPGKRGPQADKRQRKGETRGQVKHGL